jgi:hypothetical protein
MLGKMLFLKRVSVISAILIISISLASTASAALVLGSGNTTTIIGNDPAYGTGSFKVQVDYAVYDGTSASDPLGLTTNTQIAFKLTHLGGDGELPVLKFGRFIVFAPSGSSTTDPFYLSAVSVGTGKAPSSTPNIDPPPTGANRAKFVFQVGLGLADFGVGEVSKTLVVTTLPDNIPANVILEIDVTDTVPGVSGDVRIDMIPEPASIALFGIGSFLFSLRRRQ